VDKTDAAQADAIPQDSETGVDPGSLVFRLSLNSSDSSPKAKIAAQTASAATTSVVPAETVPATPARNNGSSADSKNENHQEQPQPQPTAMNGTVASAFGFQTPTSFTPSAPLIKPQETVPTRPAENVPQPEVPTAASVDRIGLTLRGADDQVVRVQINQSGELVQVGVHTGDADLASALRVSVPELMHRLGEQGYDPKVSIPSVPVSAALPVTVASSRSEFQSGGDAGGNAKSNVDVTAQEEQRQQRQRSPQRTWRELASELQED
jgi:hypothetical protein